jgi:hypothetical protein
MFILFHVFTVCYLAELNTQQFGRLFEAPIVHLDGYTSRNMDRCPLLSFSIFIRLNLVGDTNSVKLPAIEWFTIIAVLNDYPVSANSASPDG